jgi:hypothetical protein
MLTLRRACGAETALPLSPSAPLLLGRAHVPGAPSGVSREQVRVAFGGGGVTLTTVSKSAPTLLRCGATGKRETLPPGASRPLRNGDAFALCAAAPDDAWFTLSAGGAEQPMLSEHNLPANESAGAGAERPPPAKRGRADPDAAIDLTGDDSPVAAARGGGGNAGASADIGSRPLFLLLSGVQGCGKSTFCAALPAAAWRRVNQDSVSNGKPGSRAQCLAACLAAARAGRHVAVDRTHLSAEQRADFVSLALLLGAQPHCLELALPAALCAQRVRDRTDHEGGVQGEGGARTAAMASRAKDNAPPVLAEGFTALTRCTSDADVARALARYAAMPPPQLPPQAWREPSAVSALIAAVRSAAEPLHAARRAAAPAAAKPQNAFAALMAAPARGGAGGGAPPQPQPRALAAPGGGGGGGWDAALVRAAAAPERTPGVLFFDAALVALRDGYPKARSHTLLIARDAALDAGPAALRAVHAPLIVAMRDAAARVVAAERQRDAALAGVPFRIGFHAVPSMRRLHCHVISGELSAGQNMKHKKHWNSFSTPFFIPLMTAAAALASPAGRLALDDEAAEAMLRRDMRCHRCGAAAPTMPRLRDHLASCAAPIPDAHDADF